MAEAISNPSDIICLLPDRTPEHLFFSGDKRRLPPPELHSDHSVSALSRHVSNKDGNFNSPLLNQNQNSSASSNHKIQLARFQYLKQQQLMKNQSIAKGSFPLGFFPSSSGVRAVFLNHGKESSGTGVFLPRQRGKPNEPKKQPGMDLAEKQRRGSGKNRPPWAGGAADRLPPEWTY